MARRSRLNPALGRGDADARFATANQISTVSGIALRGRPKPTRPVDRIVGFFGKAGHGWSGTTNVALNDTTTPMLGSQSVKMTIPGASGQENLEKSALTPFSVVDRNIRLTFRLSGSISQIIVYLASDNGLANRYSKGFIFSSAPRQNEDTVIEVPIADFGTSGTPDPANIIMCRVIAQTSSAGGGVANIGAISTVKDGKASLPNGAVVFSADDSNIDHWNVMRPKLAEYGYAATLFPNYEALVSGSAGNHTVAQAQYMQDVHGFDFGAHCSDYAHHIDLVGKTEAYLRAECEAIIAFQRQYNLRGSAFAWPNGSSDALGERVMGDYFTSGRSTNSTALETFPPINPMATRAINPGSFTLAQNKAFVDKAKASHAVAHFLFHSLPTTKVSANDMAKQDFYDLVDYIAAQAVPVYTATQLANLPIII